MRPRLSLLLILFFLLAAPLGCGEQPRIVIGSKAFTESKVLGEIAKKLLTDAGFKSEHRQGMGGTLIVWEALRTGAITMYPEYTGTISEAILKPGRPIDTAEMRRELAVHGVGMTGELGFNNTYALVMRRDRAEQLGIHTISDLKNHPDLQVGVSHEFLKRGDGWMPLAARYGLQMPNVRGIDHTLAYGALVKHVIDITDGYSTDAEIGQFNLVALQDDLNFFPQYKAVFLYRLSAPPRAIAALRALENTIDEKQMVGMNAEAEKTKNYTLASSLYFGAKARQEAGAHIESLAAKLARLIKEHLKLVGLSLLLAIVVSIPLGILASRRGPLSALILGFAGVVQTIPSLALLALLVPFLGINRTTAIVALFLYSLLPIIRNTATALQDIPTPVRESAEALGLEPFACLVKVYLPMASRTILAGIKTSAIINIGTATLAALIGVEDLGEPILSGLQLNDSATILQGAIPAALLALLAQFLFDLLDRLLIPKGLRLEASRN